MARKDLTGVFQQVLGRAPTEAEESFFGRFVDEGHLQPQEVVDFLQAGPEAAQPRLQAQTKQYGDVLAGQDEAIMSRAGDQLASQFYQQGRPRSSGYASAYLNAARDLAIARQPQVADFYRQGFQGVQAGYDRGAGALDRGYGLRDQLRKRQWDIEDYYRQQNDFNSYLNAANRRNRNSAIGGMLGTGAGAAIGGYFGGPAGAQAGAAAGGQFGGQMGRI